MKDEGSWIYFLVIIILSIIGSIKKKKKELPRQVIPEEEEEDFPTVFSPVQVESPKDSTPANIAPDFSIGNMTPIKEGTSALYTTIQPMGEIMKEESEEEPEVFQIHDQNEIRKGIIFSEILNRKYF